MDWDQAIRTVTAEEIETLLCDLIAIESHAECPGRETGMVSYLRQYLEKEGLCTERMPVKDGRDNLLARLEGEPEGPVLLFNGHTDTVPACGMKRAFDPCVDAARIRGRGSADMKGALAAMAAALVCLARGARTLKGTVVFAATVGEEEDSIGAFHLLRGGLRADYALVGEPTGLEIGLAHKGVIWGEAVFEGRSAHGSVPEMGINAIHLAGRWIQDLQCNYIPGLAKSSHPLLGSPTLNIAVIQGGYRPAIVPARCTVQFERRLLPGERKEEVLAALQRGLAACFRDAPRFNGRIEELEAFGGIPHPAWQADASSPLCRALGSAYADTLGASPTPRGLPFWTEAALFGLLPGLQAAVCGPGSIAQAHSSDEWISREQLYAAYRMYVNLALRLCASGGQGAVPSCPPSP